MTSGPTFYVLTGFGLPSGPKFYILKAFGMPLVPKFHVLKAFGMLSGPIFHVLTLRDALRDYLLILDWILGAQGVTWVSPEVPTGPIVSPFGNLF